MPKLDDHIVIFVVQILVAHVFWYSCSCCFNAIHVLFGVIHDAFEDRLDFVVDCAITASTTVQIAQVFLLLVSLHLGKGILGKDIIHMHQSTSFSWRVCAVFCCHRRSHKARFHLVVNDQHAVKAVIRKRMTDVLDSDVTIHGHLAHHRFDVIWRQDVVEVIEIKLSILVMSSRDDPQPVLTPVISSTIC